MTNFKVGDKVTAVNAYFGCRHIKAGDVGKITKISSDNNYRVDFENQKHWHAKESDLEIYKPKVTKNQRIAALENEVAELKIIVEQLRKPSEMVIPTVEVAVKSPNELRAEIIKKAKVFLRNFSGGFVYKVQGNLTVTFDKHTKKKGFSRCNQSDVFNEHIGKAIALGRALGLDISEFEQAVQPERSPEQIALYGSRVVTFKDSSYGVCDSCKGTVHYNSIAAEESKIINDTNAIYGGVENE